VTTVAERARLWTGRHLRTTIGVFALAFMIAFEYLAVAAVMPDVATALDGLALYAVAFSAPMAVAIIGYTVAGPWIDERGPRGAINLGVAVFSLGLLIAGLAPTMLVFLLGRAVQGFGSGVVGVALYVVVAQAYPQAMRARAFTVLTGAWVLPALLGPVVAASIADSLGWRWVFLAVPVVAVAAWALIHDAPSRARGGRGARRRLGWAIAAAGGVLLVSVAGQRDFALWPLVLVVAGGVVLVAGPRLLPRGAWRAARGLPSVIGTRGLIGAAFAAAEAYVPLLLTLDRGLSLTQAGWVLTVGAVVWFVGSWLAANLRLLHDEIVRVRLGTVLLAIGVAGFASTALGGIPLAVPVLAWGIAGLGIGMAYTTLSVLTLAAAPEGEEGRASSALQLNDSLVQALVLALGSVVFAGFAETRPATGAVVLVIAASAIAFVSLAPSARLRP